MLKELKKEDFPEYMGRFVPFERHENYSLWDIVDTKKLEYVWFIMPYTNIKECENACNIMNVVDYLLKEIKSDVE